MNGLKPREPKRNVSFYLRESTIARLDDLAQRLGLGDRGRGLVVESILIEALDAEDEQRAVLEEKQAKAKSKR